MTAKILLPKDRHREGTIVFDCGTSFRCLGRSDQSAANEAGNPSRNPVKRMGDLPTGEYLAIRQLPHRPTAENIRSYGPGPYWLLVPVSGDGLTAAENGRTGIELHAGALGHPMPPDALRPTHGCCRTVQECINWLNGDKTMESAQFDLTVEETA